MIINAQEKVILLIEDNPNDVELTKIAFEQNRISNPLVVARDGEEALDYLFNPEKDAERDWELPILIILDLKLPKVDGLQVLKKIRENEKTRHLPVVILTSSKEQHDVVDAYASGTNAYVRKPIDFTEFIEAVRVLGIFWLILNESPERL